jgi:hypothetical protein
MLGLGSVEAAVAYWLCLGVSAFCIAWGLARWNAPIRPDAVKPKKFVFPSRSERGRDGGAPA